MAIQTSFAEKVTWSQDCNHRFLALLGNDGELDLALLDVKNRVRDLSLRKNDLILPIFGYRFSLAHFGEKFFRIERGLTSIPHKDSPVLPEQKLLSPDEDSANPNYFSNSNAKMNLFKKPQPSPVSLRGAVSGMS
jgi:hypothetical protein